MGKMSVIPTHELTNYGTGALRLVACEFPFSAFRVSLFPSLPSVENSLNLSAQSWQFLDDASWVASDDGIGRNVFCNNAARANHRVLANGDATQQDCARTD